jgi:hypothetical protein
MTGQSTYQTGDVNLAAALMAVGIPLDIECPVKLIESSYRGKPYGSFLLAAISEDGQEDTKKLMDFWSGGDVPRIGHPFVAICEFIRAKPEGVLSSEDWLTHAIDWLADRDLKCPGLVKIDDIPDFVKPLRNAIQSYILAFVYNRWTCFQLYNNARRSVHQSAGNRHTMIDTKLAKPLRNELLARLEG